MRGGILENMSVERPKTKGGLPAEMMAEAETKAGRIKSDEELIKEGAVYRLNEKTGKSELVLDLEQRKKIESQEDERIRLGLIRAQELRRLFERGGNVKDLDEALEIVKKLPKSKRTSDFRRDVLYHIGIAGKKEALEMLKMYEKELGLS